MKLVQSDPLYSIVILTIAVIPRLSKYCTLKDATIYTICLELLPIFVGYGGSKYQQPNCFRHPPRPTRQAVEALDKSLDMEIVAREQRQVHIEEEICKGRWGKWQA